MRVVLTIVGLSLLEETLPRLVSLGMDPALADELGLESDSDRQRALLKFDASTIDQLKSRARLPLTRGDGYRWNANEQEALDALVAVQLGLWHCKQSDLVKRRYSSAEIASLSKIKPPLGRHDQVWLLASETYPGLFCAYALRQVFLQLSDGTTLCQPGVQVPPVEVLQGVQVLHPERLQANGLLSWATVIERAIKQASGSDDRVLLNITGGYKGLAPIGTLLAFALSTTERPIETIYLYEDSDELLALPGSDLVQVDLSIFQRYESDWERLPEAGAVWPDTQDLLTSRFKEQIVSKRRDLLAVVDNRLQLTTTARILLSVWQARKGEAQGRAP